MASAEARLILPELSRGLKLHAKFRLAIYGCASTSMRVGPSVKPTLSLRALITVLALAPCLGMALAGGAIWFGESQRATAQIAADSAVRRLSESRQLKESLLEARGRAARTEAKPSTA